MFYIHQSRLRHQLHSGNLLVGKVLFVICEVLPVNGNQQHFKGCQRMYSDSLSPTCQWFYAHGQTLSPSLPASNFLAVEWRYKNCMGRGIISLTSMPFRSGTSCYLEFLRFPFYFFSYIVREHTTTQSWSSVLHFTSLL
jgi:hypothetical protein